MQTDTTTDRPASPRVTLEVAETTVGCGLELSSGGGGVCGGLTAKLSRGARKREQLRTTPAAPAPGRGPVWIVAVVRALLPHRNSDVAARAGPQRGARKN